MPLASRRLRLCLFTRHWISILAGCLLTPLMTAGAEELRNIEGRYVRVVTDLPQSPAVDDLPRAFDAAVPLWCEFWEIPLDRVNDWRVTAYVMNEKERFRKRELIPPELPGFPHGFQWGERVWVVGQKSDYYTRHLLLHEGVHAFAAHAFGGTGPAWFMEGTAELLGTHRWNGGTLQIAVVPESKEAFPYWGRFRLLDQRRGETGALSLVSVLRYSNIAHRVEPYAWTWAAAMLFHMYPEYRTVLVSAARAGRDDSPEFTRDFVRELGTGWNVAQARWRILVDEFDYGYDIRRNVVEIHADDRPWDGRPLQLNVGSQRGWQSAGVKIPAGTRLQITAEGRCIIGRQPKPWVTEPQGVTVRYHRGRPLGQLLATLLPTVPKAAKTVEPLETVGIGRIGELIAREESWLLLRVGDSPAELADNQGGFQVTIVRQD